MIIAPSEAFAQRMAVPAGQGADPLMQAQQAERQQADAQRAAQQEIIDTSFADQMLRADEMEQALRASGLADVAERFRRSARHQAFNVARRGLAGGSADIEQQTATRMGAQREGEQASEQARLSALEQVLKAISQRDKLTQSITEQDPFVAQMVGQRVAGVQQDAAEQAAIRDAQRQIAEARAGRTTGMAQAIGGGLGALGGVLGNYMRGSARGT